MPSGDPAWRDRGGESVREIAQLADLELKLEECVDPSDAWGGKVGREVLREQMGEWLAGVAPWTNFTTLTFSDEINPHGVSEEVGMKRWAWLLRELNRELFGKRYMRKVGGSYFSYALANEFQVREALHFHVLTDRPIHYTKVHRLWEDYAGFAWIEQIRDREAVAYYVSKYMCKCTCEDVYLSTYKGSPNPLPGWWIEPS